MLYSGDDHLHFFFVTNIVTWWSYSDVKLMIVSICSFCLPVVYESFQFVRFQFILHDFA